MLWNDLFVASCSMRALSLWARRSEAPFTSGILRSWNWQRWLRESRSSTWTRKEIKTPPSSSGSKMVRPERNNNTAGAFTVMAQAMRVKRWWAHHSCKRFPSLPTVRSFGSITHEPGWWNAPKLKGRTQRHLLDIQGRWPVVTTV